MPKSFGYSFGRNRYDEYLFVYLFDSCYTRYSSECFTHATASACWDVTAQRQGEAPGHNDHD